MSSFTCFEYFANVLDCLESDADREVLALAIIYYGTRGEEPNLPPHLLATFTALREPIDNSINSRTNNKGGRPKGSKVKQEDAKIEARESHTEKKGTDDAAAETRVNEKDTGDKKSETGVSEVKTPVSEPKTEVSKHRNLNQTKPNQTRLDLANGEKRKRFKPPTAEEVEEYAKSRGHPRFDAERFVDFYESKGWVVGKSPMKDWRAAVRNWAARDKQEDGASNDDGFDEYA